MMQLPVVPEDWQTVLKAAQRTSPDAFIAGGALRDLRLGREPKDVDICVSTDFRLLQTMKALPHSVVDIDAAPGSCVDCEDPTLKDLSALRWRETTYEFLIRDPNPGPRERIALHDFGITRIAWDFNGWWIHDDYLEDEKERVFRARSDRTPHSTIDRAYRFSRRFQGFRYDLSIFKDDPEMKAFSSGPLTGTW